jgi:tRNA(Ile)-lysidine synthase
MDSLVLLHAIAHSARRAGALNRVLAIHVDHGLDPDSSRWADQCRSQAESLAVEIELQVLAVQPGSNLEARARAGRYQVFESLLGAGDLLLLAHHAGDQLESRLLHLLQGRGLYGMPSERALGAGRLMRPLLGLPRQALAAYARLHDLVWLEDPSNADESLDRNFLRQSLLPLLTSRFPSLAKRIDKVGRNLEDMLAAMDELAGLERRPLPLSVFDGLSQPARLALLRRWLSRHAQSGGASRAALEEFLRQLDAGNDRQPSLALPGARLIRYRRALHLAPEAVQLEPSYPMEVPGVLRLPHGELVVVEVADDVAAEERVRLVPPVVVRFATDGLKILSGGHERAVRDLMREAGIPPWQRTSLPLLADTRGVALVPGVAVRDAAAAGPEATGDCLCTVRWQVLQAEREDGLDGLE